MSTPTSLKDLQKKVWNGSIPLQIQLAPDECRTYDESDPYLIQSPRLSYLPFLLPRLHAFFRSALIQSAVAPSDGWFSYQGIPLKWDFPVGLLYDIYSGAAPAHPEGEIRKDKGDDRIVKDEELESKIEDTGPLPFRLVVHFMEWPDEQLVKLDADGKILHDAFINSVKEADFLRNGSAKTVMSLSKDHSTQLWRGVEHHDLAQFNAINNKLLNPPGSTLRHLPFRVYLPGSATEAGGDETIIGTLRVVQGLVPVTVSSSRRPQTLGSALNNLLPSLFPSPRNPLLAQPVLHGAVVPLSANAEELVRAAAYADGWVHMSVLMLT